MGSEKQDCLSRNRVQHDAHVRIFYFLQSICVFHNAQHLGHALLCRRSAFQLGSV